MNILKEADSCYKKGQSELKTGVFKWSKDYNSAVTYFDEAVTLYKKVNSHEKAIDALKQAKLCNLKLSEIWGAARNLEAIVNIMIDNIKSNDIKEMVSLTTEASSYFIAVDQYTESIKLKLKLAKYISSGDHETAVELLESGLTDANEQGQQYNKKDVFDYLIEILVARGDFQKAIATIKRQFTETGEKKGRYNTEQYGLCIVVLCLLADEPIRAEEEIKTLPIPEFYSSREYEISNALIEAFNNGDQEDFTAQSMKASVTNLYPASIPRLLKKKVLKKQNRANQKKAGNDSDLTEFNKDPIMIEQENDFGVL